MPAKFLSLILGCVMASVSAHAANARPDHVFLLIGQSNMVGRAPLKEEDRKAIPDCLLWNGQEWEAARAGFNRHSKHQKPGSTQGMNGGPAFVAAYQKANPGVTVGIVCWARGGTSIEQWHPDHLKPYDLYREAVKQAHAALKQGGRLTGILWHQGEANSGRWESYPKLLQEHVARLRREFDNPKLPFVFGQLGQWNEQYRAFNEMIPGQAKVIPHSACVRTDGLTNFDPYHFDRASQLALGKRYADEMLELIKLASADTKNEPTNAGEAAAKKAKAAAALDAKYQAWVKTLSPKRQAWERVLQSELGGFYLPIHKRQKVAGQANAWDFVEDDPKLPRVLLIGDSVSRAYTETVRKQLAGKANVHRAPANCGPTSTGLKKIDIWLGDGKWDLIHFNFGIHDRNTAIGDYTDRLEQLIARMKKTGATLIFANTTPLPEVPKKRFTARSIVERNAAAAKVMAKHRIEINDLFSAIAPRLSELQRPDDCHFTGPGNTFLGEKVAAFLEPRL